MRRVENQEHDRILVTTQRRDSNVLHVLKCNLGNILVSCPCSHVGDVTSGGTRAHTVWVQDAQFVAEIGLENDLSDFMSSVFFSYYISAPWTPLGQKRETCPINFIELFPLT